MSAQQSNLEILPGGVKVALVLALLALVAALLVGLVDTFGKVLLPQAAGMLVYMLMAAVLLWKPEGLFKA